MADPLPGAPPPPSPPHQARPRTVLICHHDAPIHFDGIARWLHAQFDLAGIIRITEPRGLLLRRLRRERARVGLRRLLDVLGMRVYYRVVAAGSDGRWLAARGAELARRFPASPSAPVVDVATPNAPAAEAFLRRVGPTLVVALCKNLLAERIFSIPTHGTLVFHPGICPEYRNAHGCFWALAAGDLDRVGLTVLRIDRGIDTGPVLGYFTTPVDEVAESHIRIQHRMLLDNLDGIADLLHRVARGDAASIDTTGRTSHEWGQPWLTAYLRWKRQARRRRNARHHA